MDRMTKFSYINKQKQRVEYSIDIRDVKTFKIELLEKSQTDNLGDIFIMKDGEWEVLDYYNN